MLKVLTAEQMREADRLTTEIYKIPGLILMENAGISMVRAIEEEFGPAAGKRIIVLCGKGNNGGDGAVVARQLWMRGAKVDVLILAKIDETKGDARSNYEIIQSLAEAEIAPPVGNLAVYQITEYEQWVMFYESLSRYALCVDGLLGTGITRAASGLYGKVISDLAAVCPIPIVSIDIPSGLSADSGQPVGPNIKAALTVSFTAPKPANALPPAVFDNGRLIIAPIGTPDDLIHSSGSQLNLVEDRDISFWLDSTVRNPVAHKGDCGDVLVIAGSRGKTGAACLTAEAVLRAGAGLVTVASPESAQRTIAEKIMTEAMTEALAETVAGAVSREAIDRALELAVARDVIVIGPGLSSAEKSTRTFVRSLVMQRPRPVVIDADGLNCLAPWAENLRGSPELPMILTPHPGEMARLAGLKSSEVVARRVEVAREFATSYSLFLVLKGSRTLVAAPDGEVYIIPTGNAGMATAGSGDVLTGIIAGFLAQSPRKPLEAAIAGAYLHGLAGDIAGGRLGMRAMTASDITGCLAEAILRLGTHERPERVLSV